MEKEKEEESMRVCGVEAALLLPSSSFFATVETSYFSLHLSRKLVVKGVRLAFTACQDIKFERTG